MSFNYDANRASTAESEYLISINHLCHDGKDTEETLIKLLPPYSSSKDQASSSDVMLSQFRSSVEKDESAWLSSFSDSLTVPSSCHYEQSYDDALNYRTENFHSALT